MDALGFAMMAGGGYLLYCAWKGIDPLTAFRKQAAAWAPVGTHVL
jgi:hypothetical protein